MDSFKVCQHIRKNPIFDDAKVILLSSMVQKEKTKLYMEMGISDYLLKPIKQSELFNKILKVLEKGPAEEFLPRTHSVIKSKNRGNGQGLKILIVEDSLVNQKFILALLEKQGHLVQVAGNGQIALNILKENQFDLILMDLQMPLMDGLEATKHIREKEKSSSEHIPIIAMTAHALKGDKDRCLNAGMDDYIAKPIKTDELFVKIRRFASDIKIEKPKKKPRKISCDFDLDMSTITSNFDGDSELFKEIFEMFQKAYPDQIETLRRMILKNNSEAVEKIAHRLAGSVSNFNISVIKNTALKLEKMGREKRLQGAEKELSRLEAQINKFVTFIEEHISFCIAEIVD
jgi:CheY-like chemotaxis protein